MRGMKTMSLRMKQSSENAQAIAEFLYNHQIKQVYYPGLDSILVMIFMSQNQSGGAVLSFSLAKKVINVYKGKVKIPILAS